MVRLLDMLRFYAISFTAAVAQLQHAESIIVSQYLTETDIITGQEEQINNALADVVKACGELPLSTGVLAQAVMVQRRVREGLGMPHQHGALVAVIQQLKALILDNLTQHYFLLIPVTRRELYEQKNPPFGSVVHSRFPEANRDIASAARCLAVDEWTAAVFHLMRVAEHGMRDLAKPLGVPCEEAQQWRHVIDGIVSAVKAMEQEKKTPERDAQLQSYSEAAQQLFFFKEAWRNHVMHAKETYDEREAFNVYEAVKHFMQRLATLPGIVSVYPTLTPPAA